MKKSPSFEQSFASHPKSAYWSRKNKLTPKDVYKSTHKLYVFQS